MTGQEVRDIIKSEGLKMTEVAEKLNITPQTLNSRLNAKNVNIEFLNELCKLIGKDITYFFGKGNSLSYSLSSDVLENKEPSNITTERLFSIIESQQRIIESQQRTIENITKK